jgi:uncharacterized protein YutE (UPF0331/DUF86 family)
MSPKRLDGESVLAKLALMRERVDLLASLLPIDGPRLEQDLGTRLIVERALTHVVELAVAINSHVSANVTGRGPHDYTRSFAAAADAGLLDRDLADALAPSAGLRNLVVHEYASVDLDRLAAALPLAVQQYRRYVAVVASWLQEHPDAVDGSR